jgi:uncharacterized protein YbbC (DUF1343 family)
MESIVCGNARFDKYLPLISGKKTALVVNHASMINGIHLSDTLKSLGVDVVKIFTPEHGYKGTAAEGKYVANGKISKDSTIIVSLYGIKRKPSPQDLDGIDVVVFDLQDVGVRFYTYISTMTLVMEACAENNIPIIVLDRPNPNGFYVDGPVLEKEYKSFVGMHPVPVVYGMTIGEYAGMVNGEGWLKNGVKCDLTIVKMLNYNHNLIVKLPVKPSPNLPDWRSVYLYPSLGFFEGTVVSVGRGTETPFQMYGHPGITYGNHYFIPKANNISLNPKLKNDTCRGELLVSYASRFMTNPRQLNISWLIKAYNNLKGKEKFFNSYFIKLAGTPQLQKQIEAGKTVEEIRKSWQPALKKFKKIRKKYLIYK